MNYENTTAEDRARANEMRRRSYAKSALKYDKQIGFCERRLVGTDHRPWACSRARGRTLEVAIGTGLNLPHYPEGVDVVGLDLTKEMLALAAARAEDLGRAVELKEGDAQELPFEDASFDTVLCTFSLCGIPDVERAVAEMSRVLKPGGNLVLVDHISSSVKPIYWLQRAIEFVTKRTEGEHMTRRPMVQVERTDLEITQHERSHAGVIERLVASKPID
jgi:ubiquinone/menaquinone biosynthesis C-methylase UbiE